MPLTRGLEDEIVFATPSELAKMLQRNELDAALVSVTEVLFNDLYDILDGVAIASLGLKSKASCWPTGNQSSKRRKFFAIPPR